MDDLIQEFLTETTENLAQLDVDIVALEQDNNNTELLSNIFRTIHTIKGTCGFIGLPRLEKVAHAGENVLGKFRDGELEVTPGAITVILECIDRIKDILTAIEEAGSEPKGDDSELIGKLDVYFKGEAPVEPASDFQSVDEGNPQNEESISDANLQDLGDLQANNDDIPDQASLEDDMPMEEFGDLQNPANEQAEEQAAKEPPIAAKPEPVKAEAAPKKRPRHRPRLQMIKQKKPDRGRRRQNLLQTKPLGSTLIYLKT